MLMNAHTSHLSSLRGRHYPIFAAVCGSALIAACVPVVVPNGDGTNPPPGNGDGSATFTVAIQASNVTPQVLEQVTFRCTTQGTTISPVTFAFQSPDVTLGVDGLSGTATYIISESDLGLSISVTCTATDGSGISVESSPATVTPTA